MQWVCKGLLELLQLLARELLLVFAAAARSEETLTVLGPLVKSPFLRIITRMWPSGHSQPIYDAIRQLLMDS